MIVLVYYLIGKSLNWLVMCIVLYDVYELNIVDNL